MTVSIDKHGEVSMKLSEWSDIAEWLKDKPELAECSINEVIKLYITYQNSIENT